MGTPGQSQSLITSVLPQKSLLTPILDARVPPVKEDPQLEEHKADAPQILSQEDTQ